MPLVFEATTEPGLRNRSTRSKSLRLISRFSTTASMTMSQSLMRGRSSSKLPVETSAAASEVKNGGGLGLLRRLQPGTRDASAHLLRLYVEPARVLLGCRLLRGDIEEERGDACVGEVGGDLRAHRARAEDSGLFNPKHRGFWFEPFREFSSGDGLIILNEYSFRQARHAPPAEF